MKESKEKNRRTEARRVSEIMKLVDGGYYLCPGCRVTLDREFQNYCDRCGQRLDWSGYQTARVIYPGRSAGRLQSGARR